MGHALISPLNWGLGHATRDIPIIRELMRQGHEVTIATSGNALALLQKEFPDCNFILFKDYTVPYSSTRFFLPKFTAYLPILMRDMAVERRRLNAMLSENKYDLIISDNRLGVFTKDLPCYFITHQLRFSLPGYLYPFEAGTLYANSFFHKMYTGVIVPDDSPKESKNGTNLSGKLCRSSIKRTTDRTYYSGILTSTYRMKVDKDLDFLFIVSGPEPQRTKLEEIVLKQVQDLPGEKVVLLGSPQKEFKKRPDPHTRIEAFVSTEEKIELMNRAKFIISRSGYTTMMEVAELGINHGMFIPTPGQTEQEYLSRYYAKNGWFYSKSQYKLNLVEDVETAMKYNGFPDVSKTDENVRKLYQNELKRHLN